MRLKTHEAEAIVAEERSWKCEWCDTLLGEHEVKFCRHCRWYIEGLKAGLFNDPIDYEDPAP